MQGPAKKQKKIIPVLTHFSAFRRQQKASLSVSTSRSKGLARKNQQVRKSRDEQIKQLIQRGDKNVKFFASNYGLDQACISIEAHDLDNRQKGHVSKKDQLKHEQKISSGKHRLFRKMTRSPQKSVSCDSIKSTKQITPKKGVRLNFKSHNKISQSQQTTNDTQSNSKTIRMLQKQSEYYSNLYIRSQQQIQQLKKQAEAQKIKLQRVRQIYREKIHEMDSNKQICQRNLGHIFSYDNFNKDIIPTEIIAENEMECSLDEILDINKKYESDFSMLSVNSR